MNNEKTPNAEEQEFDRLMEFYLRSTGQLFPTTPAQVEAFEKYMSTLPAEAKAPATDLPTAAEILARGYQPYKPVAEASTRIVDFTNDYALAARNGKQLSEETLRKMREETENETEE